MEENRETGRTDRERIRELEQELEHQKAKYRIISGMVQCGLWEYGIATGELVQSRRVEGMAPGDRLRIPDFRRTMSESGLIAKEDAEIFSALCDSMEHGDEAFSFDLRAYVDEKTRIWLRYEGYTVYSDDGAPLKVIGRTLNVSDEKEEENVVIREAETDPVTGLYTQVSLQDRLEEIIRTSGEKERFALYVLDVDDFSSITGEWGHAYGDYVLEKLAKGLQSVFMDSDAMARIEDDVFVMIKTGVKGPADVYSAARAVAKAAERIDLKKGNALKVSMGVSIFPLDGRDYTSLYRKAVIALEETKKNPANVCTMYEEALSLHQQYKPKRETPPQPQKTEAQKVVAAQQSSKYGPVEKYIVNKTFDMLAGSGTGAEEVVQIFEEIGKYYKYRRIYTIQYDVRKQLAKVRYDWESEKNPYYPQFDRVVRENYDSIRARFANDRLFLSLNTAQLGIVMPEEIRGLYGNSSLFQYVIIDNDETFACICFEKEADRSWSKEEQDVLINLSKLLAIYIERARTKEMLADELKYTHAIIENQQITSYAVIPETMELVYVGDYTGRQYPLAHSGEHCYSAIMGRNSVCQNCPVAALGERDKVHTTETYYTKQKRWISTTASRVTGEDGEKQCLVCWSDVTEFVERVRSKDALTGQLTAEKFEADATRYVSEHPRASRCMAYFSFPQFHDLNEVWGYQVCNEILRVFASTVASMLRTDELLARISGADFVMMLDYEDRERTQARVEMILQSANTAVLRLYPDLQLNVWCGLYRFQNKEDTVPAAVEKANRARKAVGSMNSIATIAVNYEAGDAEQKNSFRAFVENSMRDALTNREFKVFFQPKRDPATDKVIGAEALVRWITSEGQVLEPGSFMPIFEENGFVTELDYYVHKETFRLVREWLENGVNPPVISLGSSWQYMFSADFVSRINFLLQRYNVPADRIELVIPDGMSEANMNSVMEVLTALQEIGFVVDIDNYLARCSLKSRTRDLPANYIKQNPELASRIAALERKRLSGPMAPEDFTNLIS
ncbi:MAG: diguanylate cyclase [Lachnospiraceae bacterium]|nr:diguanylate cyclase [Lachnospiraceae bacterium]